MEIFLLLVMLISQDPELKKDDGNPYIEWDVMVAHEITYKTSNAVNWCAIYS